MLGSGSAIQSVTAVLISLGFMRLYIAHTPFHDDQVNRCAEVSLWQLFAILYLIMVTQNTSLGEGIPFLAIDILLVFIFFGNILLDLLIVAHMAYEWRVAKREGRVLDERTKNHYVPFHRNTGVTPPKKDSSPSWDRLKNKLAGMRKMSSVDE